MSVTTAMKGFRVEDITFKKARRQSEIDKENGVVTPQNEDEVEAPKSVTPEQLINYYEQCIEVTEDLQKKRVFSTTIRMIRELLEARTKLVAYRQKELREVVNEETPNDIQE